MPCSGHPGLPDSVSKDRGQVSTVTSAVTSPRLGCGSWVAGPATQLDSKLRPLAQANADKVVWSALVAGITDFDTAPLVRSHAAAVALKQRQPHAPN